MDPGLFASVVVVFCVLVVGYRLVACGASSIGGLFHSQGLGWPTGVQEDDDFAWRWTAARRERDPERLPDRVDVTSVHGAVRRARSPLIGGCPD